MRVGYGKMTLCRGCHGEIVIGDLVCKSRLYPSTNLTVGPPPVRLGTNCRATSQLPFRSVLLSLRLEIAIGNPHPRQREAKYGLSTLSISQTKVWEIFSCPLLIQKLKKRFFKYS